MALTAGPVCVELAAGELIGWVRFALTSNLQGPDFYTYYSISLLLLNRGPGAVYDFAVQKQFQEQVTSQWSGQFILLPHILPPWVTLIFYPLGLLPYRSAYLAWGFDRTHSSSRSSIRSRLASLRPSGMTVRA